MSRFRNQESMMDRLTNLDSHLREICFNLASYNRKIAKTRDNGDTLVASIVKFAEEENISSSLRYGLTHFADYFGAVQDQRNTEVFQLEGRIIQEMSVYGELCKKAKEETRKGLLAKAKAGDITRSSSINEIHNAVKLYEVQIDRFEQKKLSDLKKYFKELVQIEMYFHSKSVELLTKAYRELIDINEQSDLNSFRNHFGIKRNQSPIRDNKRGNKAGSNKVATSLRRFSSSPEVSSEKQQIPKAKSDSSDSEDEDEDEIIAEVHRSETPTK